MKKMNENQLWLGMFLLPGIICAQTSSLSGDKTSGILYAALLSILGGLLGFGAYGFTKEKGRLTKAIAIFLVAVLTGTGTHALTLHKPNDAELVKQDWIVHQIGQLKFSNPEELSEISIPIPEILKDNIQSLKVIGNDDGQRMTMGVYAEFSSDTFSVMNVYSSTLLGMFEKLEVDTKNFFFRPYLIDTNLISGRFSYSIDDHKGEGYGYLFKDKNRFSSAWLFPIQVGFSEEYIDRFAKVIVSPNHKSR